MIKRAAVLVLASLTLAGCAGTATAEPTKTRAPVESFIAEGTVSTAPNPSYFPPGVESHTIGDLCEPTDGYDDVALGSQVIISDDAGKTVGVGELTAGVLTGPDDIESILDATCVFTFRVDVKSTSDFYGVQVGNDERGDVKYKKSDLTAGVDMTIGL